MAKYALVIGVAQYKPPLRNLPKAAGDAEAVASLLESQHYEVSRSPSKLVGGNQWAISSDKSLTGRELNEELKTFLRERAVKQEAVIYFAGHGFQVSNSTTDELEGYLATSDCTPDGRNAIKLSDLHTLIGRSELSSLVMLLDCCYAGTLLDHHLLQPLLAVFNQKQNYQLITACRGFERAREGAEHGIFTSAVLQGLRRENADNQGQINSSRLFDFVSSALKNSGQEPIQAGLGKAITLVSYYTQTITDIVDEKCPYQGLEPFDRDTAQFFFGRESVIQQIVGKLEQDNFVPVIGGSGSGKSSVVRAGLIPVLEKQSWHILTPMLPGSDPLGKLTATFEELFRQIGKLRELRKVANLVKDEVNGLPLLIEAIPTPYRFLLVVDQFEEIFTLCSKESDRNRFINLLTQIAEVGDRKLSVIITVRADFVDSCLDYNSLTQLIQSQAIYIPPLDEAGLRQAITEPARLQGYSFGEGLLELILRDIGNEQNCLPLLQFALTELWEQRDQRARTLTVAQYKEQGGVSGALNRRAEELFQNLTTAEQDFVKRICLRLVRTGAEIRDTRQRRTKQNLLELAGRDSTNQQAFLDVIHELMDGRLLVTDDQGAWVDLAHEALMDSWERFANWRQEDRELRRLLDRIDDARQEWLYYEQDPEYFMMGGLLNQVKTAWTELQAHLDTATREFCEQSLASRHSFDKSIVHPIGSEMAALAELAIARLVLPNPYDPSAEVLAKLYSERLSLKNTEFSQGEECQITCQDLFTSQPEIRGDLIWECTLFAKVGTTNLRWGQVFVNIKTGRSELLLDNRPGAWTNTEVLIDGNRISKLKLVDGSFTKVAIETLENTYSQYFNGERSVQSYGGWLKDSNRKRFQIEFAKFKENHPEATDEEATNHAIRETSFGKARIELGITEFNILLTGMKEEVHIDGLGVRAVPTKIIVMDAKRANTTS
jgi:energy-coupling factor transporter ATP-binding protein EcfA2